MLIFMKCFYFVSFRFKCFFENHPSTLTQLAWIVLVSPVDRHWNDFYSTYYSRHTEIMNTDI
jgi:hypothetical protein